MTFTLPLDAPTTTDDVWLVDNTPLNTLAYNIETIEGRFDVPPKRGDNPVIGNRQGTTFVPKLWDQRPLSLAMWVRGCNPDGTIPRDSQRETFMQNWMGLKKLFGQLDRLLVIERRISLPLTRLVQFGEAEITNTMPLTPQGPSAGRFVVEMMMPDPLWYSEPHQGAMSLPQSASGLTFPIVFPVNFGDTQGSFGQLNLRNVGDEPNDNASFDFFGPMDDPSVIHTESGNELKFDISLGVGDVLHVDLAERSVTLNDTGSRYNALTIAEWFRIEIGDNIVQFRGIQTSGAASPADPSAQGAGYPNYQNAYAGDTIGDIGSFASCVATWRDSWK